MKPFRLSILAGCLFCAFSQAHAAGTTSAAFLKLGVGAKNIAMGETGAADGGINAVYWNPAGLCSVETVEASFTHAALFEDITLQHAAFARRVSSDTFAASLHYLTMPGIDKYDNTGTRVGASFKPVDMAFVLSYAREIENVPFGLSLKYVHSDIDGTSAGAVAFDMGLLFHKAFFGDETKFRGGLAIQNIGTHMQFNKKAYSLPSNLKLGGSYAVARNSTVALDFNKGVDTGLVINAGGEYILRAGSDLALALRAGYRNGGSESLTGITFGFGATLYSITADYAFVPYGDLESTHRVSLRYRFGGDSSL